MRTIDTNITEDKVNRLRSLLPKIKEDIRSLDLDLQMVNKWRGDLSGLLLELEIPLELQPLIMELNNIDSNVDLEDLEKLLLPNVSMLSMIEREIL